MRGILAGMLIGIGGTCYLSIDDKVIGALLFSVGLLVICKCKLNLFTGKICYVQPKLNSVLNKILIFCENLIGASTVGLVVHYIKPDLIKKATNLCEKKLLQAWYVTIPLSIFCGVLIFFAVEGYKAGSEACVITCVTAFIVCGFEHCIANIYYLVVASASIKSIIFILLCTLGNTIGGIGAYRMTVGKEKDKQILQG